MTCACTPSQTIINVTGGLPGPVGLEGPAGPQGPQGEQGLPGANAPIEEKVSGAMVLQNAYTLIINTQGVEESWAPPVEDTLVVNLGTLFDETISGPGELKFVNLTPKVVIMSLNFSAKTTNPTSYDVVKTTVYVNGVAMNGGLVSASNIIDNNYYTSLTVPVFGGPLQANDVITVKIANLSSDNDLEFAMPSQIGGFSFTDISL